MTRHRLRLSSNYCNHDADSSRPLTVRLVRPRNPQLDEYKWAPWLYLFRRPIPPHPVSVEYCGCHESIRTCQSGMPGMNSDSEVRSCHSCRLLTVSQKNSSIKRILARRLDLVCLTLLTSEGRGSCGGVDKSRVAVE